MNKFLIIFLVIIIGISVVAGGVWYKQQIGTEREAKDLIELQQDKKIKADSLLFKDYNFFTSLEDLKIFYPKDWVVLNEKALVSLQELELKDLPNRDFDIYFVAQDKNAGASIAVGREVHGSNLTFSQQEKQTILDLEKSGVKIIKSVTKDEDGNVIDDEIKNVQLKNFISRHTYSYIEASQGDVIFKIRTKIFYFQNREDALNVDLVSITLTASELNYGDFEKTFNEILVNSK